METAPTLAVSPDEAYAIAALFDGARRVAQTALCVLALEDVIDLGRDVEATAVLRGVDLDRIMAAADADIEPVVAVTGTPDGKFHSIERAAIELIGSEATVSEVIFELRRAPEMHELIEACSKSGLVGRTGLKLRRRFGLRARWEREVSVFGALETLATRRLVLAVHGPLVLFESAPEIPLALGCRRPAPPNAWMLPGSFTLGGTDFGSAGDGRGNS